MDIILCSTPSALALLVSVWDLFGMTADERTFVTGECCGITTTLAQSGERVREYDTADFELGGEG